ncbi:CatB-related O-acetyltransferase [Streptosporangium album]|uniref:CatB-related O-acetyltransferase n=1 Tax=Streptosporangium album TaxID=47479 RepID=UPI001FE2A12B|nr:CatB-related O-acetyltransferase [Streptosporangium album]
MSAGAEQYVPADPTVVGNDVWFGYRAMVMPGVRIGDGAITASGSVVVDDIPDYGIVGGNPARLIRRRYSDEDIIRLLALAWWDWPLQHITEHIRTIMSGSVDWCQLVDGQPMRRRPAAGQRAISMVAVATRKKAPAIAADVDAWSNRDSRRTPRARQVIAARAGRRTPCRRSSTAQAGALSTIIAARGSARSVAPAGSRCAARARRTPRR